MLKLSALGSAAMLLPLERRAFTDGNSTAVRMPASKLPKPYSRPFATPPVAVPYATNVQLPYQDGTMKAHDVYRIHQQRANVEILPGKLTGIYGYNGHTPGVTIRATQGKPIVVQHVNDLPASNGDLFTAGGYKPWTSTHLHGSASLPEYDGYASDITNPTQWKNYHYPNIQNARTLWYHDHGVHHTAENAYMGLAAQYHLTDAREAQLGLPIDYWTPNASKDGSGIGTDVPLIIKDAMFADGGATSAPLLFDNSSGSGMYGDVVLVNGVAWPNMKVERRKYRFRVLNASISRSYKLKLAQNGVALDSSKGMMTVISTDGGYVKNPLPVQEFRLGMAERYDVVIDFSKFPVGTKIQLTNVSPPNNIDYTNVDKVMQFEVYSDPKRADFTIPQEIADPNRELFKLTGKVGSGPYDSKRERSFRFERSNGQWTVNGSTWADVINTDYKYCLANPGHNEIETWTLQNNSGGWFHPVHIHLIDFKVISRTGGDSKGRVANGLYPQEVNAPKDVVYVGEGETVKVAMRFDNQDGRYMMHCHNLVHEDHDMMAQFWVGGSKECLSKSTAKLAKGSGSVKGEQCDPVYADVAKYGDCPDLG